MHGPPGHVCMCKTRAGDAKIYNWFFETVVIPTSVKIGNLPKENKRKYYIIQN